MPPETKPTKQQPSNRFMVSFADKYKPTHDAILKAAAADDREPGEYLVRWLSAHFKPVVE